MRECRKCREGKPRSEFYRERRRRDGLDPVCKECRREAARERHRRLMDTDPEWRIRERARGRRKANAAYTPARQRAKRRRHPKRDRARRILNYHVRKGNVQKPDRCEDCGRDDLRMEAHHDDYDRPLDVDWLCSLCHGKTERV